MSRTEFGRRKLGRNIRAPVTPNSETRHRRPDLYKTNLLYGFWGLDALFDDQQVTVPYHAEAPIRILDNLWYTQHTSVELYPLRSYYEWLPTQPILRMSLAVNFGSGYVVYPVIDDVAYVGIDPYVSEVLVWWVVEQSIVVRTNPGWLAW